MTLDAGNLRQQARDIRNRRRSTARYVVAFSGGLDSTVLLHALVQCGTVSARRSSRSISTTVCSTTPAPGASTAAGVAEALGVEFLSRSVSVQLESGKGPEASARDARYAALHAETRPYGDWLLSAHHREDQAETLLLNLIRGSGPMGIAGIGRIRRFGPGWLLRPLLDCSRDSLLEYAQNEGLQWLE